MQRNSSENYKYISIFIFDIIVIKYNSQITIFNNN